VRHPDDFTLLGVEMVAGWRCEKQAEFAHFARVPSSACAHLPHTTCFTPRRVFAAGASGSPVPAAVSCLRFATGAFRVAPSPARGVPHGRTFHTRGARAPRSVMWYYFH
jgi:hypothetical protein